MDIVELWKKWNVRGAVLLSLMLQIVLILLGKSRKRNSKLWIRIVVWCAYVSADYVAAFAIGAIANNISHFQEKNGGSMEANIELTAFWAPFLLMHLGGPDTITAYSLEDNELWLRHFLELVVQMAMAIYVCVMAWTGSLLSFLSLLILFAGLIKYGERTWVLRKASVEVIRQSFADLSVSQLPSTLNNFRIFLGDNLFLAYWLVELFFQPFFLDLNVIALLEELFISFEELLSSSVEDALEVIEMSLAFMYNNLYTKAFLLYTYIGVGLRVISVILTSSVSVLFTVVIHKHKFAKMDVTITFILLFGAITLEIYSALLLLFSDRFQIWLIKHRNRLMMFESFKRILSKKKRWSNKMSQLSLVSFSLKEKPLPCRNLLKHFRIVEKLENQWYAADIEIPYDLKKLILTYLKSKRDQTAPSENLTSIDVRGMDFTEELEINIIAWHIATEKWYVMEKGKGHVIELICQISRYMFSLLVLHPNMLSNVNTTTFTLQPILVAARGFSFASRIEACQNLTELPQRIQSILIKDRRNLAGANRSIFDFFTVDLPKFLRQLDQKHWEERWMIISCTWLEMLLYAAYKCRGRQHARRLTSGGEFLTHVWLLTKCLRFTDKDFTSHAPWWASSILGFGGASLERPQVR